MKMKLSEFKARVEELAGGRYHSVRVEITEYSDGLVEYGWRAYIEGVGSVTANKPESVILGLQGFPIGQKPDDEELPT
jgi:hypothetical protein